MKFLFYTFIFFTVHICIAQEWKPVNSNFTGFDKHFSIRGKEYVSQDYFLGILKKSNNGYLINVLNSSPVYVNNVHIDDSLIIQTRTTTTKIGMHGPFPIMGNRKDTFQLNRFASDTTFESVKKFGVLQNYQSGYSFHRNKLIAYNSDRKRVYYFDLAVEKWDSLELGLNFPQMISSGEILIIKSGDSLFVLNNDLSFHTRIKFPFNPYSTLNSVTQDGNSLYLCTSSGIILTKDDFQSFDTLNNNLESKNVNLIKKINNQWYAGTNNGMYILNQGNWNRFYNGTWDNVSVIFQYEDTFFAGGISGVNYLTQDNPRWENVRKDEIIMANIYDFASDNNFVLGVGSGKIITSADSGKTWRKMMSPALGSESSTFTSCVINNNTFYTGNIWGEIFASNDKAEKWQKITTVPKLEQDINPPAINQLKFINNTLIAATINGLFFTSNKIDWTLAIHSPAPSVLELKNGDILCGTFSGLMKSSSLSGSWTNIYFGKITSLIQYNNNLYMTVENSGIYKSTDNGVTWIPFNEGLVKNERGFYDVTLLSVSGGFVFVQNNQDSTFILSENNQAWQNIDYNIHSVTWSIVVVGNKFIRSAGGGIYELGKNEIITSLTIEKDFNLDRDVSVFPNPFTSFLNINSDNIESYTLLNVLGEVALHNDQKHLDVAVLPCGVYLIQIKMNSGKLISKKLIKE